MERTANLKLFDGNILEAIIDDYTRLQWNRYFLDVGTLSLTLPQNHPVLPLISQGKILVPPDITTLAYVIEQIEVDILGRAVGSVEIVCNQYSRMLGERGRLAIPPSGQSHDVQQNVPSETAMKHYVSRNAGEDAIPERRLPNFEVAADQGRGANVTYEARYQYVTEVLEDIGIISGMGYEVTFDHELNEHIFEIIEGVDRSQEAYFDLDFETIQRIEWLRSTADLTNFVYVAGQGSGEERTIVEEFQEVNESEPTGWDRREAFIDARDIDDDTSLRNRGRIRLGEDEKEETFRIEVNPLGSFRYRDHWDLGDIVTVRNTEWDILKSSRIVGISFFIESSTIEPRIVVEFDKVWKSLEGVIESRIRRREAGIE